MPQDQRYGRRSYRSEWDDEGERDYGRGGESWRNQSRSYSSGRDDNERVRSPYEHDTRQDRDYQGTLRAGDYGRYEEEDDFRSARRSSASSSDYRESGIGRRYGKGGYSGPGGYANREYGDQPSYTGNRDRSGTGPGNYGQGGGFGTYARDFERKYGGGSHGNRDYGRRDRDYGERERGWWDRATDEVSSWFGDRDAEHRREIDHHRGRGPKNYTRSDDRIREDVSDRLTDDPLVDASDIDVTVQSQEVTLTGTVSSRNERRLAEETVEAVSGVKYVQNNLRVKPRQTWDRGSAGSGSTSGGTSSSSGGSSSDMRSSFSGGGTTM